MRALLLLVRLVLAAVFAVAGVAKLRDRAGARKTVVDFGVPTALAGGVALLVPVMEIVAALALVPARTAWWGATGLLALLGAFSVAMIVVMARGKSVDCRCFGQLNPTRIGPATLARNLVLAGLATSIVARGVDDPGPSFRTSLAALDGGQMLNLVLGLVIAVGVFVFVELLKQHGKLLIRIEALEARGGAGAAPVPPPPGLPVGTPAPSFSLAGLDGKTLTLEKLGSRGKPIVLVFVSPKCVACDDLLPDIATWQREHGERLAVTLISRGASETRAKIRKHDIRSVLLQRDNEVADSYQVSATPGAVLVKDGAIASSVATGVDAIRALVQEATLPPPVARGDAVPSMTMPLLAGGSMDVSGLPGRSLMLFWNPGCGFCQQMLDDLKRWERDNAADGIALVVASAGSPADIRKDGFESPVILDSSSAVMRVFGVGGTPSAVVIEDGRVVSEVGVGAPGIWALPGIKQAAPA